MPEYDYWPEMRNGNLDIIDDRGNLNKKEAAIFMDSERFLPIANIGRIMKNTLEPIKDLKGPKPRKTHKKKERQTSSQTDGCPPGTMPTRYDAGQRTWE